MSLIGEKTFFWKGRKYGENAGYQFVFFFSPFSCYVSNLFKKTSFSKSLKVGIMCSREPFPKQALVFTCLKYKSFENTAGKGEIARNEQFLLFPQCFLPAWRAFINNEQFLLFPQCFLPAWRAFINKLEIVVCQLFHFGSI